MTFEDDDEPIDFLSMAEKSLTAFGALFVQTKGASDEYVVQAGARLIDRTAYKEVVLKGDSEPALVEVNEKIAETRKEKTPLRSTPKESKGS